MFGGGLQAAGQRDWSLPDSHQMQLEGDKELYVGGVHVHIFLKDPHFPLRNPKVTLATGLGLACWHGNSGIHHYMQMLVYGPHTAESCR